MADRLQWLLKEIDAEVKATRQWLGLDALSPPVREALANTPREQFVPEDAQPFAFDNRPLSIGFGQTISQPYIVAIMTELLCLQSDQVVLEAGTGSGYQTAVLAQLAGRVYSMEVVPELAAAAAGRLRRLGFLNVEVRAGNAWNGWPEHAPFDAVMVTAAASCIPPALFEQLRAGGRMILPVDSGWGQDLVLVTKDAQGRQHTRKLLPVVFVPFVPESDQE